MNNKKKLLTILFAFTLGFSTLAFSTVDSHTVSAAGKYKVTPVSKFKLVKNQKKTVYMYWKPSTASKKAGKLPKNSGVVTTGKTKNGFSQITYAFTFAYVKTADLKSVQANTSNKKYAWDISKNIYYKVPNYKGADAKSIYTGKFHKTYSTSPSLVNFWLYNLGPMLVTTREYDTKNGLYEGLSEEGELVLALKYPIKKNSTWYTYGVKNRIVSTNMTVQTPAGKFKNVVKVNRGGTLLYYAPNKGLIKISSKYGKKYQTDFIIAK